MSLSSREDWKPVLDIQSVVYGIVFLFLVSFFYFSAPFNSFKEPNPADPLNKDAAKEMQEHRAEFEKVPTSILGLIF